MHNNFTTKHFIKNLNSKCYIVLNVLPSELYAKDHIINTYNLPYNNISKMSVNELNNWFKSNKDQIKSCDVIAYEPTGGYERTLTSFLKDKSLPGFRAHANHVRYYAKAMSLNAKTDNIDAKIIAEFAISKCNAPDNIANHDEDLTALISRRQQLIDMKKNKSL